MGLHPAARFSSPSARTAIFYFTLFMSNAVSNPFLAIWLTERGIGTEQIGIVNAVPIFLMIVLNLVVGRIADRAKDWRSVIVAGSLVAAVTPIGLFFASDLWSVLLVWVLVIVPFQAISPVVDAASYRMARRTGADFGAIRVWGTIGFILMTVIAGFFLDWNGAMAFVPLIVAASVVRAVAALGLPLFRGTEEAHRLPHPIDAPISTRIITRLGEVWQPWFILPLIGAALLHGSHMMQMSFGALVWQRAGLSSAVIGLLWAVSPIGEVLVMLFFDKLTRRFTARNLILLACLCGVVRWWGLALEPPLWGLVLLQVLHMATFGLAYLGIVNFIANWTSEDIAAEAQSFFVVIRQAVSVVTLTGFGFLVAPLGAGAYYAASALAALGVVLTVTSLFMMHPRHETARNREVARRQGR